MSRALLLSASLLAVVACNDGATDAPDEVFPDGESTWTGTFELQGVETDTTVTLTRTGHRLQGEARFRPLATEVAFELEGTIDLVTHQVALRPRDWIGTDPGLEVVGLSATYDPTTGILAGTLRDTATWDENTSQVGPIALVTEAAPAAAPDALPEVRITEPRTLVGTFACSGTERPLEITLEPEASGRLSGEMTFTEPDGTDVGVFAVDGVDAGGHLTLLPLAWTEDGPAETNYLNFFLDGPLDDTGYTATVTQNLGAICIEDGLEASFE